MVRRFLSAFTHEVRGLHEAAYLLAALALFSQLLGLIRDRLLAGSFDPETVLFHDWNARAPEFDQGLPVALDGLRQSRQNRNTEILLLADLKTKFRYQAGNALYSARFRN